ncbi:MAG: metallophosphoesterase [Clostridiales bacterium]|jgi:Icc-related predicted phosphoesterase|nr:metallophosphoesterase [Clostridiales bacterium]
MKILAVSDIESRFIWDYFDPDIFKSMDIIISCGDLKASYLSFLVTMIPAPLFYVHGNHDSSFITDPPDGCTCIDGKIVEYKGLKIGGLGGCRGTKERAYQYTDSQMWKRSKKFETDIKKKKGLDILVTHAPPLGFGDGDDEFHRGFEAFLYINEMYEPKYHFFGHRHLSGSPVNNQAVIQYGETTLINATGYRIVEFDKPVGLGAAK